MMNIKQIATVSLLCFSFFSIAQESTSAQPDGYISEDLVVYMHSGSGKNYRILGTVNAGEKVKLTGQVNNAYSEIITEKDRTGWVESKMVSTKPGLRYVIADLNEQLATLQTTNTNLKNQVSNAEQQVNVLKTEREDLQQNITTLNMDLSQTKSQLKNQDTNIKKEWFFNGAIVLGLGLLLGLVLPRLFSKRKSSMENWG